ncbi:transcription-repair coupling factor [Natronoglycomyces albus]|uniref:Transcription-repair-coupling factor n=1 Tax=Natronoglycomyces albus TaxID=2811108 RepID=A0A895XLA8_9ACTN|nr:transcription-repair coupling factor [Natronoglycomyces albus]QSB04582.1 transcription-repair coupling factor [Natronoglycomyces albus]
MTEPQLLPLLNAAAHAPALRKLTDLASQDHPTALDLVAVPGARPTALAAVARQLSDGILLVITATSREAEELTAALAAYLPEENIGYYPAWETLPHERLSPRSDTVGRRIQLLHRLVGHSNEHTAPLKVVVTPVRGALQPQLKGLGKLRPIRLREGDEQDLTSLANALHDLAYERVDLVEKRGQFALRGGILDVFPPTAEYPIRLEFFGDEIDSLRYFSVADQRSLDKVPELIAEPCRELLLTPEVRQKAQELAHTYPNLADMCSKLAEGIPQEGMESLLPVLCGADQMELLHENLPARSLVVAVEPERISSRAHEMVATSTEFLEASWSAAAAGSEAPIDLGAVTFRDLAQARTSALALGHGWWTISPFASAPEESDSAAAELAAITGESGLALSAEFDNHVSVQMAAAAAPRYHGNSKDLVHDVKRWTAEGWQVALVYPAIGGAKRAAEQLGDFGVGARVEAKPEQMEAGTVLVCVGPLPVGFVDETARLAVITAADVAGGKISAGARQARRAPARRKGAVDPLELKEGDYVVHQQHGVGKYIEMVRRTIGGAQREYLVIEYAPSKRGQPGDRLFMPTDSLDQLSRYVGGEMPTVHKLGGSDWTKAKNRARKAVKEIAAELIRLYAARQATQGHAFAPDTPWQQELEDSFAFIETPDQYQAIVDTKRDMEAVMPMDRLVCGDVGYGKTEVAVRAAFKAVQDGKQVGILVPTTLLASQHLKTFQERMGQFPIRIRQLSRFQTLSEARQIQEGLAKGEIDIVIGTHRLLQSETRFKDLGLLIVDEEQRFGVEHKEKLKALRASVDVLTMSATPIPRTLEMAVTGLREMSTIATPPEERHPVLTYVGAWEAKQVAATIRRELLRDGQVFYLHNRVESIDKAARTLRDLVPEARIATAHGRMGEKQLEQIMQGFWEGEYDVLISTTIVESGIDIPNANTLIVERADHLGLSQLHQIRGRVGRGRERAYAYFLYPPEQPLSDTAHERLATIAQHSELGAGMYVAMKDLEIRGAGNLLGAEQSGHIADVGFDLYLRMVGDAVRRYKGAKDEQLPPVKIELPVEAHLPVDYISVERLRLEMYRKIAEVRDEAELDAVREELEDRYGALPDSVENLLHVANFRLLARRFGLQEVALQGRNLRFSRVTLPDSKQMRLKRHYPEAVYKDTAGLISIKRPSTARVGGTPMEGLPLLQWCADLITDVFPQPSDHSQPVAN